MSCKAKLNSPDKECSPNGWRKSHLVRNSRPCRGCKYYYTIVVFLKDVPKTKTTIKVERLMKKIFFKNHPKKTLDDYNNICQKTRTEYRQKARMMI
jgi:hypothetical protein